MYVYIYVLIYSYIHTYIYTHIYQSIYLYVYIYAYTRRHYRFPQWNTFSYTYVVYVYMRSLSPPEIPRVRTVGAPCSSNRGKFVSRCARTGSGKSTYHFSIVGSLVISHTIFSIYIIGIKQFLPACSLWRGGGGSAQRVLMLESGAASLFGYGMATISRLLKIIGLFCKRAL